MEKLSFKLITNGKNIIDEEVNYFISEDKMHFMIDKVKYTLDLNNSILTKEDSESLVTIDMKKSMIHYYVKSVTKTAYLPLNNDNYVKNGNNIQYKYKVPENDVENTIIINY